MGSSAAAPRGLTCRRLAVPFRCRVERMDYEVSARRELMTCAIGNLSGCAMKGKRCLRRSAFRGVRSAHTDRSTTPRTRHGSRCVGASGGEHFGPVKLDDWWWLNRTCIALQFGNERTPVVAVEAQNSGQSWRKTPMSSTTLIVRALNPSPRSSTSSSSTCGMSRSCSTYCRTRPGSQRRQ